MCIRDRLCIAERRWQRFKKRAKILSDADVLAMIIFRHNEKFMERKHLDDQVDVSRSDEEDEASESAWELGESVHDADAGQENGRSRMSLPPLPCDMFARASLPTDAVLYIREVPKPFDCFGLCKGAIVDGVQMRRERRIRLCGSISGRICFLQPEPTAWR